MFKLSDFRIGGIKISGSGINVIDELNPEFSWKLVADQNDIMQLSYHITVGSEPDTADMWDSGEVQCSDNHNVIYKGKAFLACTQYYLKITVTNNRYEKASLTCSFETAFLDETLESWSGAKFIGAPEYYVCAETIGVFSLESTISLKGKKAGIVFGADDFRLNKKAYNELLVEGENYILYAVNEESKQLEIYRVGYAKEDQKDVPLFCREISTAPVYHLKLDVMGNYVCVYVNGQYISRVQLNPISDNSVTTYPRLNKIGYYADKNTSAHFDGISARFMRHPSHVFFACDKEKGISVHIGETAFFDLRLPDCHALPMFRRNFSVGAQIKKARLYVTARGCFECSINGKVLSDEYFAPGASQFDKHLYYKTYDIGEFINEGENGIGFTLFSGWWNGSQTYVMGCYNLWGDKESFMAKLVLTYENGQEVMVTNERDWDYYGEGAYKFGGFFQGERLDGRAYEVYKGFSLTSFKSDKLKKPVEIKPDRIPPSNVYSKYFRFRSTMNETTPALTGRSNCPVKEVGRITAQKMHSPSKGIWIYDLEQEIAGTVQIKFHGKSGEMAVIRYAEMLYPDLEEYGELAGHMLTANLRDASSTDKYILSGSKDGEVYSPRFTFHGFRYIEISGVENPPAVLDVIGIQLSSVDEITGEIVTDNALINRFVKNVKYSMLCNFISIPTDCPQRDERMGWAGDTHVFCKTALRNADVKTFYLRYLEALRDGQDSEGNMPDIAPVGGGFGGITYGCAIFFIANELYDFYGDSRVLSQNYEAMTRYMSYLGKKDLPGNAQVGPIDDWLAPERTDSHLIWNAFYGRLCALMAKFAQILGNTKDAVLYKERFKAVRQYFGHHFLSDDGTTLCADQTINDSMGSYAIALAYGMIDEALYDVAAKKLAAKVRQSGYRIMTGFFGTGLVMPMLSRNGYLNEAYGMMTQTQCPSWLYSVTQGATTIWEHWDSYTQEKGFGGMNTMNSFNHYAFGSVLSWLYEYALGIRLESGQRFIIKPDFAGFSAIHGGYETPYGFIESGYKKGNGKIEFYCVIPANTKAKVVLPNQTVFLGSGRYEFAF